jgi:hypothetical protein
MDMDMFIPISDIMFDIVITDIGLSARLWIKNTIPYSFTVNMYGIADVYNCRGMYYSKCALMRCFQMFSWPVYQV